ncbi:hypothetical protein GGR30_002367 [Martelella radicis]|uniref:Uncharacterized protein n=1 Tax=Martelella radicis TaxID=1397476 RepID=A0A7W6KMA7_9HYPH|nr:hypothetical protein [Martelella radicis]
MKKSCVACATLALLSAAICARAEDNEELAKQLSNPVANLISVPLQFNYDGSIGSAGGRSGYPQHTAGCPLLPE